MIKTGLSKEDLLVCLWPLVRCLSTIGYEWFLIHQAIARERGSVELESKRDGSLGLYTVNPSPLS